MRLRPVALILLGFFCLGMTPRQKPTPSDCSHSFTFHLEDPLDLPYQVREFAKSLTHKERDYERYGRPSTSAEPYKEIKDGELLTRLYESMGESLKIPLALDHYKILRSEGGEWQAYARSPPKGQALYTWSSDFPSEGRSLLSKGSYLTYLLGARARQAQVFDVQLREGHYELVGLAKRDFSIPLGEQTPSQVLEALGPDARKFITEAKPHSNIPWEKMRNVARSLGYDATVVDQIEHRALVTEHVIENFTEEAYSNIQDFRAHALEMRAAESSRYDPRQVRAIRELVTNRFRRDFSENTEFKSFEEYKAWIDADPEYKKIVDQFWKLFAPLMNRHASPRVSIHLQGFKNLNDTQTSAMHNASEDYKAQRDEVLAQNLGLTPEETKKIPPWYLPKSTYLAERSQKPRYNSQYGSDHYYFSWPKILEKVAEGKLYVTLTIGDSLRVSGRWDGRLIPFEYFPYFAAPYIHQYSHYSFKPGFFQKSPDPAPHTLSYRKGISSLPDVLPDFRKGLDKKMRIPLRKQATFLDEAIGTPGDNIEVQFWGLTGPEILDHVAFPHDHPPGPLLKKGYEADGIPVEVFQIRF